MLLQDKRCPNTDISPCKGQLSSELWAQHPIEWPMDFAFEELDEGILDPTGNFSTNLASDAITAPIVLP